MSVSLTEKAWEHIASGHINDKHGLWVVTSDKYEKVHAFNTGTREPFVFAYVTKRETLPSIGSFLLPFVLENCVGAVVKTGHTEFEARRPVSGINWDREVEFLIQWARHEPISARILDALGVEHTFKEDSEPKELGITVMGGLVPAVNVLLRGYDSGELISIIAGVMCHPRSLEVLPGALELAGACLEEPALLRAALEIASNTNKPKAKEMM